MKVCAKEVFGPVVTITAYDDLSAAIDMANDTDYGLQAAIFTSDISKALTAVRSLDFGGVRRVRRGERLGRPRRLGACRLCLLRG
jgi:acyl-CoA reductase-like NAD-dependent aldehyde dehydrogenase